MKLTAVFMFIFSLFLYPLSLLAQTIATATPAPLPNLPPEVSTTEFLQLLIQSLGGLKGAGTLTIVALVVQLIIKFMSSELAGKVFKTMSAIQKIAIVTGLTVVGGVLALMLPPTSLSLGAALVHSTTLTAAMVFANEIYKGFIEKKT